MFMNKRRFTPEIQQEQISRKQLSERLTEFGWLSTSPVDLGEDFIVHIYLNREATGVTFHVQEKSVINLSQRRKANSIVYPFKTKDLKHWAGFSLPVVLIVWDVKTREGRWELISNVIAYLDKNRPNWRNNKATATVRIPWENTTDDNGLEKLKQAIGHEVYPLIADGRQLEIKATFSFPDTPEGQDVRQSFERHIQEGEPVTLKGRFIQNLQFSEWWGKWFGAYDPDKVELHLETTTSKQSSPVGINIVSEGGKSIYLSNIELKPIKIGTSLIQFTNEEQDYPLLFSIVIRQLQNLTQVNVLLTIRGFGYNVQETFTIMEFLQAISVGGKLGLTFAKLNNQTLLMDVAPQKNAEPDPRFFDLVRKLCVIQEKTKQFFSIPQEGISLANASAINELYQIVEHGFLRTANATISGEYKEPALRIMLEVHRQGKPIHFRLSAEESFVELFGKKISTGPTTRSATGFIEMPLTELEQLTARLDSEEFLPVKIIKAEVIETFPQWNANATEQLEP
jgi:hypothetical protein